MTVSQYDDNSVLQEVCDQGQPQKAIRVQVQGKHNRKIHQNEDLVFRKIVLNSLIILERNVVGIV
jgi:hypothetical protein